MSNRRVKLTERIVDGAVAEKKRYALSDTDIPGLALLVWPSGKRGFYYRYRHNGRRRDAKLGAPPAMKVAKARSLASEWAMAVAQGKDPQAERVRARHAPTMSEVFDRYMQEHAAVRKKPSSASQDESLIRIYLNPALGKRKIAEVTRTDVASLHSKMRQTPHRANRALALLSKVFNLAEVWGLREDNSNPTRHVAKFRELPRKRFLSREELARLGVALKRAEAGELGAMLPSAVVAIRLILLTGARRGEVLGLKWDWIDWERGVAQLPDSKTGEKQLVLSPPALDLLRAIERVDGNPHVIVGGKTGAPLINLKDPWAKIRKAAGLDDVRIHDLRHSFGAVGAAGGASLHILGGIMGHTNASTTKRYAHLSDDPLQAEAAKISSQISEAMKS